MFTEPPILPSEKKTAPNYTYSLGIKGAVKELVQKTTLALSSSMVAIYCDVQEELYR